MNPRPLVLLALVEAVLIAMLSWSLLRSDAAALSETTRTRPGATDPATPTPSTTELTVPGPGPVPGRIAPTDRPSDPPPTLPLDGTLLCGRISTSDGSLPRQGSVTIRRTDLESAPDLPRPDFTRERPAFAIPGLAPGSYELTVKAAGFRDVTTSLDIAAGVERARRDIELHATWELLVEIVTPEGRSLWELFDEQPTLTRGLGRVEVAALATASPPPSPIPGVTGRGPEIGIGRWNGILSLVLGRRERPPKRFAGILELPIDEPLYVSAILRSAVLATDRVAPGSAVHCRIDVGAPDTLVTLAVIDERIYTLAPDRTRDPSDALRPDPDRPWWIHARTDGPTDPLRLLGALLVEGRIPALDQLSNVGPVTPGPAGASAPGGPGAGDAIRTDFRATALFETVVTDTDGIAELRFAMPDDLTTWRVTIIGIERDGSAFRERRSLVTAKPLAAEPRLPRVLRAGDAIDLPIVVDRAVEAAGDAREVALALSADGLAIEPAVCTTAVAPGRSGTVAARIRATAPGAATLAIDASVDAHGDRSRRTIDVAPDVVAHPLYARASGKGRLDLTPAEDSSPESEMELTVLGSAAAVRRILAERLTAYPYGCVEQTLSGLLPFFAEARGARVHDRPAPTMDAAFRARLAKGLRRLRDLQDGTGGGFAWWPGGKVDRGMTALVLHGLCVMREGGLDPKTVGLAFDVDAALQHAAPASSEPTTERTFESEELAAGCLAWAPEHAGAHAAVVAFVDRDQTLPPGLLARTGLALWAAGDHDRARACLGRIATTHATSDAAAFPGESPLAVQALAIELAYRTGVREDGNIDAAIVAVLAGTGSTYAHACALAALALVQPITPVVGPIHVTVRTTETERRILLEPDADFRAVLRLPFASQVHVVADEPTHLRAQLRTRHGRRASDHPAWSTPLVVARELLRRTEGGRFEPLGDERPHVGERLAIRVRVTSPQRVRYAVIECPLPAGVTLPLRPNWIERFDDRVAFTASWIGPRSPSERLFEVVPTHAGRVLWPPTTASAMYVADCEGGSAGEWIEIAPARALEARVEVAPCFAEPLAVAPSHEHVQRDPTKFEVLIGDLDELWRQGFANGILGIDPEPDQARIDSVFARIGAFAAAGPPDDDALRRATRLMTELPRSGDRTSPTRGAAWAPWRLDLGAQLATLQRRWTLAVLRACEEHAPCYAIEDRLAAVGEAIATWRDAETREAAQARLLHFANTSTPLLRSVLEEFYGTAQSTELRDALLACALSTDPYVRQRAVELLPLDALAAMPPAVLAALPSNWLDPGVVGLLSRSDDGSAELLRMCGLRQFVEDNGEALVEELPDALWDRLPLEVFVVLAADGDHTEAVAARLADSTRSDDELCSALVRADHAVAREFLARVLGKRRVPGLGAVLRAQGPVAAAWDQVLSARAHHDANSLDAFLDALEHPTDAARSTALLLDEAALRDLTLEGLAACAPPAVLARRADDLPWDCWTDVFARLGSRGQEQLLRAATAELPELPDGNDLAQCDALWDYGVRCDDLWDAVDALRLTPAGARFARERAEALPTSELRERALRWTADDPTDWIDDPVARALHLLAIEGPDRTWNPADLEALHRALRLRGLR